jgi:hypothetical protein
MVMFIFLFLTLYVGVAGEPDVLPPPGPAFGGRRAYRL